MSSTPSRRRLLVATATTGIAAGAAGCQSSGTADDAADADADATPSRSPCDAATEYLEAAAADADETLASYAPSEHTDRYADEDVRAVLETREFADGAVTDVSCERSAADLEAEAVGERYEAPVSALTELEATVSYERDGETVTESIRDAWVALDGAWYPYDGELTVELSRATLEPDVDGEAAEVVVSVVDRYGTPVPEATVIATPGSALLRVPGETTATTVEATAGAVDPGLEGAYEDLEDHRAVLAFDGRQSLRADQPAGTIELAVESPDDSRYVDNRSNPELDVVSR